MTGDQPDADKIALFSTIAAEAARSYLESRRKTKLINALKENQANVDAFAAQMQQGVKIAATITKHEYDEKYQEHLLMMTTPSGPASEPVRRESLLQLISLDRKYIKELSTFNSLHQAFGRIPSAHEELIKATSNSEQNLTSMLALLEAGKRLETNYDQALVANKSKAAQSIADKALAQAEVLEAEANATHLRAAAAEVNAINAQAESDVDPSNANKQATAEQLKKKAKELKELADTKKIRSEEAKGAAMAAQQYADEIKRKLLGGNG